MMQNQEWRNGEFTISTDRNRLQTGAIHKFLSEESYWATERTLEQTTRAIKNSLPFGVYKGENLVGFARVVTDYATFAYLGDVFILEAFRGKGLSKWLMETIINHPDLQGFRRWILATRDAPALYEKFGFTALEFPDRWMEKAAPNAY
ncbi:MAG TPA: GNAT family N-acetyltransferase [Pyrinomonadaceae bacterium]|nr:GNAT family N-acetyltransferase [Pyrinomonadaceae bacterium]